MSSNPSTTNNSSGMGNTKSKFLPSFLEFLFSFLGIPAIFAMLGMLVPKHLGPSLQLLVFGSIMEAGRRLCQWVFLRFRFRYSTTARLDEGDPAYEWVVLFLIQEGIWKRSRDFVVSATNSQRKWSVKTWPDLEVQGEHVEYVPRYQFPQLFRWRGHWVEIRHGKDGKGRFTLFGAMQPVSTSMTLTIYSLEMNLLSALIEDARTRYVKVSQSNIVVHTADSQHYSSSMIWTNTKQKVLRPLSSIILEEGILESLVKDAQDFFARQDWYTEVGIPYRRGYLLYGPPGTGKTSTIHAVAGALNLEIYSLSLASSFVDDSFLQRAASSIPRHALFLIEDIDCAFTNRDDEDKGSIPHANRLMDWRGNRGLRDPQGTLVTLSGLLNVIDGVGSEEGKLFFATTNYVDRLDPALLRPGRIDRKVEYRLATRQQVHALFLRFFPQAKFTEFVSSRGSTIPLLASLFASYIPTGEFSTAELQGYLQSHKDMPAEAVAGATAWVQAIRTERTVRDMREEERRRPLEPDTTSEGKKGWFGFL